MEDSFSRTKLLLGSDAIEKLAMSRVAVFGVGGVGGYVCEGLSRSGVGAFELFDGDKISLTNLNRQIIALNSTLGAYKCDVMKARILDINPAADVAVNKCYFMPENADTFDFTKYDYVVDAVDTVTAKIAIILKAQHCGVPVISSMGAGNKLDPTAFKVADIYQTKTDPLAKVMRRELKKRGVQRLKVVYSEEEPIRPAAGQEKVIGAAVCPDEAQINGAQRRQIPGSVAFVPSVAGLIIAGEVVKDLAAADKRQ